MSWKEWPVESNCRVRTASACYAKHLIAATTALITAGWCGLRRGWDRLAVPLGRRFVMEAHLIQSTMRVRQKARLAERILLARGELPRQQKRELVLPSAAPPR